MTSSDQKTMELKARIQQQLVESGSYEQISNKLSQKLLQDGWSDQVKRLTTQEINSNESASFTQILSKVEPKALEIVPESTRVEVLSQIRSFLADIVEIE